MNCGNIQIFFGMSTKKWASLANFLEMSLSDLLNLESIETMRLVEQKLTKKYGLASAADGKGGTTLTPVAAILAGLSSATDGKKDDDDGEKF